MREMGRCSDVAKILKLSKGAVYRLSSRGLFSPGIFQGRGLYCLSNLYRHIDEGTLFLSSSRDTEVNEATLALQKELSK